jgi:hypothetical protein
LLSCSIILLPSTLKKRVVWMKRLKGRSGSPHILCNWYETMGTIRGCLDSSSN